MIFNWLEELTSWVDVGCGGGRALTGCGGSHGLLYLQSAILGAVEKVPFDSAMMPFKVIELLLLSGILW